MEKRKPQTWDAVSKRLPTRLGKLEQSNSFVRDNRDDFSAILERETYAFYEVGKPV